MAEKTPAQKKAQQKYMERFAIFRVRLEKDMLDNMRNHAASQGESLNSFIVRAISETMEREHT